MTSAPHPRGTSLDLESKVRLLTGATMFTLAPEPRIGLGELRLSDGPTGVRGLKFSGGRTVALFPNATLLASAWSEDTAFEVGTLLAEEAMAQQIHVVSAERIAAELRRMLTDRHRHLAIQLAEEVGLLGHMARHQGGGVRVLVRQGDGTEELHAADGRQG